MSDTRPGWYPDVAPHVESPWREAFVLDLRVLGVGGDDVGAALAEVESHVVDSGEAAPEAFGDLVAYARGLAGQRIVDAVGGDPWQAPSRWALGVGLAAVIEGTAWVWRAGPRTVDLIRGPLDGPPTLPRGVVVMTRVVHGAPLAFTVLLVVVGWLQGRA